VHYIAVDMHYIADNSALYSFSGVMYDNMVDIVEETT
jgi:hypothetical protein